MLPVQDDRVLAVDVEVALALAREAGLLRVLDRRRRAHGDVDLGPVLGAELAVAGAQGGVHVRGDRRVDHHFARELGPRVHLEVIFRVGALEAALERRPQRPGAAHDLGLELGQAVGFRNLPPGLPRQRSREEGPVGGCGGGEPVGDAHSLRHELAVELAERGSLAADEVGVVPSYLREPEEQAVLAVGHGRVGGVRATWGWKGSGEEGRPERRPPVHRKLIL